MSTPAIEGDLNATIASAVTARVEAEVMRALSGDEVISKYVTAALMEPVKTDNYNRKLDKPFLTHILKEAIQKATKETLARLLVEEQPLIEAEIRKALRKNVGTMAESIAQGLAKVGGSGYGVTVQLNLPKEFRP